MSCATSWFRGAEEEDATVESMGKGAARKKMQNNEFAGEPSQTVEGQSWYQCLWPDALHVDDPPEAEEVNDSRHDSNVPASSISEDGSNDKSEQRDDFVMLPGHYDEKDMEAEDNEVRRTQSLPSPTKKVDEILSESFFQRTGSFESISGLSLASYGTTASAMLGGLDYNEEDEKVLNNVLAEKDDKSGIEGENEINDNISSKVTPINERIHSCESEKDVDSTRVSDQDAKNDENGNEDASVADSECTENASRMSEDTWLRGRMSSSAPMRQMKLLLKGTKTNDAERKLILELRSAIKSFGRHDINVAHTLTSTGDFYVTSSEYDQALCHHEEAFSIYSTKLGDHDPRSIDSKVRIAQVQLLQGRIEDAMETFCQTLHMRSALLGEEHPSVAEVRMHVAEIQRGKGLAKEAAKEIKKALKGYREVYGDSHPLVASAVEDIAELYTEMGEHDKANLILSEIVKLRASISGSDSPEAAKALMKWGWSFEAIGNPDRAIKLMKQAYAAYVKHESIVGVNTADALEGIGKLYAVMGKKDKAIKAYTRVLNIRRQVLGENHPQTAASFVTVGKTLRGADQSTKAMKCMKRAMSIYAQCKKSNLHKEYNSAIADSLHQIGLTFEDLGQNSEAYKAFSRELSVRRSSSFQDKRRLARALNAIGVIQCKRGKLDNAMDSFTEALVHMDATIGRNATFAATLFNVGLALEKMGKTEKAYQAYAETLIIYKAEGLGEGNSMVDKVVNKIKKKPDIMVDVDVAKTNEGSLPCSLLDEKNTFEC